MPTPATHTGIVVGRKRGFIVTKRASKPRRASQRKAGNRVQLIKDVIREVGGFAPYERRVIELLKIGTASTNKRAMKFSKKRLGTHLRGKKKREEMIDLLMKQRKADREAQQA